MKGLVMEEMRKGDNLKGRAVSAKNEVYAKFADIPMDINTPELLKEYVRENVANMSDDAIDAIRLSAFTKNVIDKDSGAWCYSLQICSTQPLKAKISTRTCRRGVKVHIV